MIEENATVIAIDNDKIIVESQVKSTCSSCQQVDNCGSGQISKAIPHRKLTVKLENHLNLTIGDLVVLGIPEHQLLKSAWQVYFMPLLGLLFCAGLGQFISHYFALTHELLTIIFGVLGAFSGFKYAKYLQNRLTEQENLAPKLLRKQVETINIVEIPS
jgi:sigma-E factor negative regulatory protein RseC